MPFPEYLTQRLEAGGFTTEDALASVLPLFRQVAAAHRAGLVAPLQGVNAIHVDNNRLWFEEEAADVGFRGHRAILLLRLRRCDAYEFLSMAPWSICLSMASVQECREGQREAKRDRSSGRPSAASASRPG